ncbi:hypothetical protein [Acidihalobacter prosperus]|uniref:Uncharacterized protein n=1 Tax=Acidihalobacter prosperus TaxID=160660 RepID=A0A1A6C0T3_9GAMM|nr:hypothetical protein [Acidihalobacter prosperus]OBS08159.1 hypothetical protein Thpro_022409 [Acidihalobacter prosperus]
MKPPQPVPGHVRERLEIAALTGEVLNLHWADESSDAAFLGRIRPLEVLPDDAGGPGYLRALDEQGETLRIRLDLIRNLPTPVK